jgi:hypothetical protein
MVSCVIYVKYKINLSCACFGLDENSSLGSSQIKGSKSSNESTSLGENQSNFT